MTELPLISVIIISYNRAHTLVATVESFLALTDYPRERLELILCDDGSDSYNLAIARCLPFDKQLIATRNAGLGANMNKGLRAASGKYVLQLQDDWLLLGPTDYLRRAVLVMEENSDIAMISLRPRTELQTSELRPSKHGEIRILKPNLGPSGQINNMIDGVYSDNPHLKRRNFHDEVGYFSETLRMAEMELEMSRAVTSRPGQKVATMTATEIFKHIGDEYSFNAAHHRMRRITVLENLPVGRHLVRGVRWIKRQLKNRA